MESGKPITAVAIRDILTGTDERRRMILLLFRDHIKTMKVFVKKGDFTKDYLDKFERIFNYVKDFLNLEYVRL